MQTTTALLTTHDLAAQGFTPAEIARLQRLKERYHPFREYCESNVEFGRLAFLKWRYMQGQVEQTPA
jgi:hypothetical protein